MHHAAPSSGSPGFPCFLGVFYSFSLRRRARAVILNLSWLIIMTIDLESVAYGLIRDYPGGSIALAAQTGMVANVLSNKVNPNDSRHHLSINEALSIQHVSGDHRILQAMGEALGYLCLELPSVDDKDLMQATLRAMRAFGQVMGETEVALSDGSVTINELRAIERAMLEATAHISSLHRLLASRVSQH